ncbi:MAG: HAMP domain-containing protein [Chloroflexi bacterium]|nr:HAMP domain-containing protein [Chloroflexota bacterium]
MPVSAQAGASVVEPENQATGLASESVVPMPLHKRLRFRMAAASVLGLAVLLTIYTVLISWAIGISTDAGMEARQAVATQIADMVDDLVGLAIYQMGMLAVQVDWNSSGAVSAPQATALANSVRLVSALGSVGVVNNDGRLTWSTGKREDEEAWQAAPALAQALRTGVPAVGQALASARRPPIAVAAVPLWDAAGAKAGALVGSVQLAPTGREILPLPTKGSGLLAEAVDGEGRVLASSAGGEVAYLIPDHLALLRDAIETGRAKAAIHGEETGHGHVVAFAPFKDIPGGIVLEESTDAALIVPRSLQRVGSAIGIATLIVFSLGVWWHTGRITRPVEELSVAARTMAQGSFERRIWVAGENELGLLAGSLEEMRVRLKGAWEQRQHWLQELESRVEERTQEVHRLLAKVISAQEEERQRVARELHDGAAQYLATLLVSLDRIELSHLEERGAERDLWQRVRQEAGGALAEVRRLISDLRPAALDDLGLVPAIQGHAENRLVPVGVSLRFEVSGQERHLRSPLETALFRIVQEAVSNVIKHADARRVHLQLEFAPESVSVSIEDDGRGFHPETVGQGFGLAGMRERASLVGGFLSLTSSPGRGTHITVTIPTPERANG